MWILLIIITSITFSEGADKDTDTTAHNATDIYNSTYTEESIHDGSQETATTDFLMDDTTDYDLPFPLFGIGGFGGLGGLGGNSSLKLEDVNITGLEKLECTDKLRPFMITPEGVMKVLCLCTGLGCPNTTDEETEEILKQLKKERDNRNSHDDIAIGTTYVLVMFIGTLGNLLVLVTIFKVFKAPTVTNLFISSLSLADLMVVLVCIPFRIIDYVGAQVWTLGVETCKFFNYFFFSSFMCSIFTLTAMSMERYLVICHPMKAASVSTSSRARKIIVGTWILSFIMAIPIIFISGVRNFECDLYTNKTYMWNGPYFLYLFFVLYFIPSITMAFAYGKTSMALLRSIRTANSMTSSSKDSGKESSDAKARLQVVKMLATIWTLFTITWGSYIIFNILIAYNENINFLITSDVGTVLNQVTSLLCMANSAINPILYAFMSSQFRKGFLKCLSCVPLIKRKYLQPPPTSNVTASSGVYSVTTSNSTPSTVKS